MDHCVFIQTNHKQIVGAKVAAYALRRFSQHNDRFDVRIIDLRDYPWFAAREGQRYLRDGVQRVWLNDDLQSFTPTRFLPPQLMNFQGRALVIDPTCSPPPTSGRCSAATWAARRSCVGCAPGPRGWWTSVSPAA